MQPTQPFGPYQEVEERVQLALDEANTEISPNIKRLAEKYHVPRLRLHRRWQGTGSRMDRKPTGRLLTDDQELALVLYCANLDEIGVVLPPAYAAVKCLSATSSRPLGSDYQVSSNWP
ncbi:hypothetical protein B0J12DRAFT_587381 [Macrophomina phaseolina]|uniref:HTH psq-type domain-containing protein n=1 Tax=Macrophomina phaseolina TaxID=35725 RepID=A0ABQ8FPQ5_9PEZI|nr:hypothetical protein B0J12DRAFT_587381 [Macrophomina phaseolina]